MRSWLWWAVIRKTGQRHFMGDILSAMAERTAVRCDKCGEAFVGIPVEVEVLSSDGNKKMEWWCPSKCAFNAFVMSDEGEFMRWLASKKNISEPES